MKSSSSKLASRFISLELTGDCNNSCMHCYNYWRKEGKASLKDAEETLTRKEIKYILGKIKKVTPLEYVALSGGEPLLRPDLTDIVCDLIEEGLRPIIITNGILLTEAFLKKMPGGIHYEVSILGHTPEIHDKLVGNRVFERVIENVSRIDRFDSYFTHVFVATKSNALNIVRTVELGLALGARGMMYNRVNLSRFMKPFAKDIVPSVAILEESIGLLNETALKYGIQAVSSVPIPACLIDTTGYKDVQFGWCPRGGDNAYYTISRNGLLRPCNHSSTILGDLRTEEYQDIVARTACSEFWETVPDECSECKHPQKEACRGGCPAAAREYYGTARKADPILEFQNTRERLYE